MSKVTMRDLLEAGVHFGHQRRYWNPQMKPYIYGIRRKLHIINLEKTLPMLQDALNFISGVAAKKGKILFVGTKLAAREVIAEEAARCGMPFVDYRWLGGMLTNYKTIRQSIKRLKDLEALLESNRVQHMTKKEVLNLMREKDKLNASLRGIKDMGGLPDVLFIIDVGHEHIAITEAKRLGIPVVAVVDTNSTLAGVDYVIPGNDDAIRAIRLYCKAVADTITDAHGTEIEEAQAEKQAKSGEKKRVVKAPAKKAAADDEEETEVSENASSALLADSEEESEEAAPKAPRAKKTAGDSVESQKEAPSKKRVTATKATAKKAEKVAKEEESE